MRQNKILEKTKNKHHCQNYNKQIKMSNKKRKKIVGMSRFKLHVLMCSSINNYHHEIHRIDHSMDSRTDFF